MSNGATTPPATDPAASPRGTWFSDDGMEVRVVASTRSIGQAILLLPVGAVFCGIAALFLAFSISSILQSLGLWSAATGPAGSLGGGLCVLLFATPVAGVGLWALWAAAMAIGGRVAVTRRRDDVEVFTGIGPVGRRQRLSAASVTRVTEHEEVVRTSRGATRRWVILLTVPGTDGVRFGAALNRKRRVFVVATLQQVLGR